MAGEPNQVKWRGIRPTDPPETIPVTLPAGSTIEVVQDIPADLKATVTQAAGNTIKATQDVAANLKTANYPVARGIYPNPPDAERVSGRTIIEDGSSRFYTVPANRRLFIANAFIAVSNGSATSGWGGDLSIYNELGSFQYTAHYIVCVAGQSAAVSNVFCPALEAEAGWEVRTESNGAAVWVTTGFKGWLEVV